MAVSSSGGSGGRFEAMSLKRFRNLLDAYGATPERWPSEERDAAAALLAGSDQARALHVSAAQMDALLDAVAVAPPSDDLTRRVLAGAPGLRRAGRRAAPRRRMVFAAALMAAAAALLLWLLPRRDLSGTAPLQVTYEGAYAMPTDVLLTPPGVDLAGTAPAMGCSEEGFGCSISDTSDDTQSRSDPVAPVSA